MNTPQSLIAWQRACEESQRWAESLREMPSPYYRELLKGAAIIFLAIAALVALFALAAVLGGHR